MRAQDFGAEAVYRSNSGGVHFPFDRTPTSLIALCLSRLRLSGYSFAHPIAHFPCRFLGEGDCRDLARRETLGEQFKIALHQRHRFPTPRSRSNKNLKVRRADCELLLLGELDGVCFIFYQTVFTLRCSMWFSISFSWWAQ